ncbi:MAG: hypothetical protein BGO12_13230 [Verrucomicrobia bacterium 61-8]|nr:hypothetical protein [Verrucomicrobiota bacterium]OJV02535.1 MAG: hypothetical protein BGO12_13230 [Verrucomicrobia bacterium 61-8]
MNSQTYKLLLACLCASLSQAFPQLTANIPAPVSPYIAQIPPYADWVVQTAPGKPTKAGEDKSNPAKSLQVQTTRTKDIRRVIVTGENIRKETWIIGTLSFNADEGDTVAVNDIQIDQYFEFHSLADFPGFSWMNASNYVGVETFDKAACYHFKEKDNEAWIDVKSKLPVALVNGDTTLRYIFNPPPTAVLVLPDLVQRSYDQYNRTYLRAKRIEEDAKHQ